MGTIAIATEAKGSSPRQGNYLSGERAMIKVRRFRTADLRGQRFRHLSGTFEVGPPLQGLYNPLGLLDHIGFHLNNRL
jgi:hypothetical protein